MQHRHRVVPSRALLMAAAFTTAAGLATPSAWAAPAPSPAPTATAPAPPPVGPEKARDQAQTAEARKQFEEGKKRFALRQFHAALQYFSRAYELMPLPGFLFNIGQCHRFLGDCPKAIFFYSGFVRENPDTPDAVFVTKLIARCQKDLARDEARRAKAATLFEEARKAHVLQQHEQAERLLTEAYKTFPVPGYLFHLAEVHRARERYDQAIHFYEAYLRENPGGPQADQVGSLVSTCRRLREEKHRRDVAAGRIKANLDLGSAGKDAEPKPRPVHKAWWLWTSIAVGVAAAVALGVGLGTRDGAQKDSQWTWDIK